jgi:hypothetical protein
MRKILTVNINDYKTSLFHNVVKKRDVSRNFGFKRHRMKLFLVLFMEIALVCLTYLALDDVLLRALASNDTIKTWTFDSASSNQYTYDNNLVTVNNSGAFPGVNKFTNPSFDSDLSSWSGIQNYALYDQFTTSRLVGAVNGTSAEPTGGTRTVIDTGSKLSITGGQLLSLAATNAANPGLWYSTTSRASGKMLIGEFTATTNGVHVGFGINQTAVPAESILQNGTSLQMKVNNGAVFTIATVALGTTYKVAIDLRSPGGMYVFIKGGTYTDWSLIWIASTGTTASLFPAITTVNSNTVFTADNLRIPTTLWIPTPLIYDTFSATYPTQTEVTGPDGQATAQATWTGTGTKVGGVMKLTPTIESEVYTTANAVSDPNGNEANNVTGFSGTEATVTSDSADPQTGTYAAKAAFVSVLGRFSMTNSMTTSGKWYTSTFWAKGIGTMDSFMAGLPANFSLGNQANWTYNIVNQRSTGTVAYRFSTGTTGYIDNVSVRPLTTSTLFSTIPTSDADVVADVNLTLPVNTHTQAGIVLNLDSTSNPQNFVIAYIDGNNVHLDKAVAGVYTTFLNISYNHVQGGTLRVTKSGTKYAVYYNESLRGEATIADAGIISNTRHGLFSTYSENSFDNFAIWPRGSGTVKYTDAPFSDLTATVDSGIKYAGASSAKLVTTDTDANYLQSVNVGNTSTYNFIAYAYKGAGQSVSASDLSLYYDTGIISTSFTSVGGDWYRLSGSVIGANASKDYGVRVKSGKTIYVDEVNLFRNDVSTIYTTTAYTNNNVNTWDTFCEGTLSGSTCTEDATHTGTSAIKYQLCTDDGSACESGGLWKYWNGSIWASVTDMTTTVNTPAEITGIAMTALPTGSSKISVKAIFTYDGTSIPYLPHISIGLTTDIIPPTVPGTPSTTTPTNDSTPTWSWTASTDSGVGLDVNAYSLQWCEDSGFPGGCLGNTATSTTNSFTHGSGLADGTWYIRVKANDAASNQSAYSSNGTVLIDTVLPSVPGTPSTTSPTNDNTPTWSWTSSTDSGVGLSATPYTVEWCQDNSFPGSCAGNTATSSINSFTHSGNLADGTWYIHVKSNDLAGNQSAYSSIGTVIIDINAPTVPGTPTTSTPTADNTPTWSWTASTDSGVGLAATPYTVEWCLNSGFTGCSGNTATSSVNSYTQGISLADGTWYFRVKAKDILNNESGYSSNGSVVVDITAPAIPNTPTTTTPTADNTPTWGWTASTDSGVGLSATPYTVQWCQDNSFPGSCSSNTTTSTTNSFTNITSLADGTWYFRVKAKDQLNNESVYSSNGTVVIDTVAPSVPGTPATSTPTADNTPTWSWTSSIDSGVGLSANPYTVQWCQDSGFAGCSGNTATSSTNSYTHSIGLADGTWYMRAKATDITGGQSAYSSNGTAVIDTAAPSVPGTPSTTSPTNDNTATWNWTASTDSGVGLTATPYTVQWCQDSGFAGCSGNTDTASSNSYTQAMSLSDGAWYFRVKAKDLLDNESAYSSNGTLIIDTVVPPTNATGITMLTNSGGVNIPSNGWTKNSSPFFSWAPGADDNSGAGIKGYCLYLGTDISGDPATGKGLLGTSPVNTAGFPCQFIVSAATLDLSIDSYKGSTWLTTSLSPYYLNIKAIDLAGNVYAGGSEQFFFRYDNTLPINVAYTACASGSFANIADMIFNWPTSGNSASSDSASNLLGWQYNINSTAGLWKGTLTEAMLGLDYIPTTESSYSLDQTRDGSSINSGSNVIYFRTVDNAGNLSSDATIRTCSLSLGGEAPTFGTTDVVTVTPAVSDTNSYAISWPAATASTGQNVAGYYYMVNTPPPTTYATLINNNSTYIPNGTSTTVSTTNLTNVNKGSNIIYVVAVDDAATPNYSPTNVISGTFTLNSTDPDNIGFLVATDSSIKSQEKWIVALTWTEPVYQGAGNLEYLIYRSEDNVNFAQVGATTGIAYFDNTPTSSLFYYKIYTKDGANAMSSGTNSVSIIPTGRWTTPAELESGPNVIDINTKRATIQWSTSRGSDSKVQYGTQSNVYNPVEASNSDQVTAHSIVLSGLVPGTTYFYKVKWTDEDGNTGVSGENHFITAPAPSLKEISSTNTGLNYSLIKFTSTSASKVKIYYGPTTSFGGVKEIPTSTVETTYTAELTGLLDGTKYFYKINSYDVDGNEYEGPALTFTTLPRPKITEVRIQQVANTTQSTLLVTWNTNTETSSLITYYPVSDPSKSRDEANLDLVAGEHKMILRGLLSDTEYILTVRGQDKIGNEAVSDTQKVTTATDTRAPLISDIRVESSNIPAVGGTAQESTAQLIVSWSTDEPSTGQIEFGEGTGTTYTQRTHEDEDLTISHIVIISNLTPSKVYHLRALSADKSGNIAKSIDTVTITPKTTENALNLVIYNLMRAFGL